MPQLKKFISNLLSFFYNNTFKLNHNKFSSNPNKHHFKSAKKVRYEKLPG